MSDEGNTGDVTGSSARGCNDVTARITAVKEIYVSLKRNLMRRRYVVYETREYISRGERELDGKKGKGIKKGRKGGGREDAKRHG